MKRKIILIYNQFQLQDGVNRSAMAIANELVKRDDVDVTLMPIFKYDKKCYDFLDKRVKVKPIFGFYFSGFTRLVAKIPAKLLYKYFVSDKYDVVIAFQYGHSLRIVASGVAESHQSLAWMHCYDEGLTAREQYIKIGNVICVSKCNAERLRLELPEVNVDFNYNPIDDESIREQGKEKISSISNVFTFVSVARMSPEKGYVNLLNCVKRLKEDGFKFKLWLIGDGPMLDELKKKTQKLMISDYVHFFGQLSNPHSYVSKADVYVCSSTVEGYSTSCTEAIMLGIPVITSNCSGGQEIVEEAECGLLFDMDVNSIYNGMKYVLENPLIVNEWKKKLEMTKVRFSPSYRFKRFLNI